MPSKVSIKNRAQSQSCLQESTRSTVVLGTVVRSTVQSFSTMMRQQLLPTNELLQGLF
jgi:hypothetical protein